MTSNTIHSSQGPGAQAETSELVKSQPAGRAVPEWVGKTPDTPVPPRVKLRVFEAYGGRCYLSGRKIMAGEKWQVEHKLCLALGGENRESNLAPALVAPHAEKTRQDVAMKAKADRVRKKHLGIWQSPSRKIPSPVDPWGRGRRKQNG